MNAPQPETASAAIRVEPEATISLAALGWDAALASQFDALGGAGLAPGRVVAEHRGSFRVAAADGERSAQVSGRMRYGADGRAAFPVVGDWVALAGQHIQAVLPRRTLFVRREPGPGRNQLLAANVDVALCSRRATATSTRDGWSDT
jgi:ribosome biogenesis GTPase / thiamine phosphate phosphatase